MDIREQFEHYFPIPKGTQWEPTWNRYYLFGTEPWEVDSSKIYRAQWEAWKTAAANKLPKEELDNLS
jgi:hypothetical protein